MSKIKPHPSLSHPPYNLFSREFKANPFFTFAIMRQDTPIYAHEAPDGTTIWYITRYEDVVAVLKDHHHFVKNSQQVQPLSTRQTARPTPTIQQLINENMLFSDPPDHTRLRALVNQAFTPRRVESMRPRIQAIASNLIDKVRPHGECDLIEAYALPLPVIVITELLGVPAADQDAVCDWSQAIISPGSRGLTYSMRKKKVRALIRYLQAMFKARQQHPQDDLVTALVQAEEAGDKLTEAELSSMVALLLVTGHETTVNLIGNGILALLQHPQQLALWLAEPTVRETAVEELLRYDGPVETSTTRWASQDIRFKGHHIRQGDVVRVVLASANRDAAQFLHPDELDITRQENRHLAFGQGIHYCLGASLARLEGEIAIQTLFEQLSTVRLAIPPTQLRWRSGILFRGLMTLPICWDA